MIHKSNARSKTV